MTKLRFAPSPTGYLHLGNLRTALMNWLFARAHQGEFILRLDDTDRARSEQKYADQIEADLKWLGLAYDNMVKQSDYVANYAEAAELLKAKGRLYACYETAEELELQRKVQLAAGKPPIYKRATDEQTAAYAAEGRKPHWRFKMEPGAIRWKDLIRGEVSFEGANLSDPILIREDGTPVFTLATSVDDIAMGITHILRGEDHVTNTAVQIQIMEALSGQPTTIHFGHLALISGSKGEGLSKREGSLSLFDLHQEGMEPLAILSVLAKLGTSDPIVPHTTLQGILQAFDISRFGRASPRLSIEDLWQMNQQVLQLLSFEEVAPRLEAQTTPAFWTLVQKNISKFQEVKEWAEICYGHRAYPTDDPQFLEIAEHLLPPEPWDEATFGTWTHALKDETGRKGKDLFMPLRHALTGQTHGPELKDLILLMGYDTVRNRLQSARS